MKGYRCYLTVLAHRGAATVDKDRLTSIFILPAFYPRRGELDTAVSLVVVQTESSSSQGQRNGGALVEAQIGWKLEVHEVR